MPESTSFRSGAAFRLWLAKHHAAKPELLVRLFKVHASDRGMTYRAALDEALCHGWIDGVRRGLDDDSFLIRFTPRKPKSYWSDVNVRRMKELIALGRARPSGLAAFARHDANRAPRYSFEVEPVAFDAGSRRQFKSDRKAWAHFAAQAPSYRRMATHWVMRAKQATTRARRLARLIECSARGGRLDDVPSSRRVITAPKRKESR